MNRRTLLKSATLAAAIAAVSTSQTSLGATHSPKRIIVIGAGIAGLAAASQLAGRGHQVTVL